MAAATPTTRVLFSRNSRRLIPLFVVMLASEASVVVCTRVDALLAQASDLTPASLRYSRIVLAYCGKATSGSSISGCHFFSHSRQ